MTLFCKILDAPTILQYRTIILLYVLHMYEYLDITKLTNVFETNHRREYKLWTMKLKEKRMCGNIRRNDFFFQRKIEKSFLLLLLNVIFLC